MIHRNLKSELRSDFQITYLRIANSLDRLLRELSSCLIGHLLTNRLRTALREHNPNPNLNPNPNPTPNPNPNPKP